MKRRTALVVGLMAAALLLIIPGSVLANTNEPIAQTGGMSATLPLMGTSLQVDIALDTVGVIKTVDVNPLSGMTKTKADPGYVRFATSDGKTSVSVLARGGRLSLTERTTLDNLKGNGSWSADVFGTKAKSTVDYTIGKDGSGNPTVTLGAHQPGRRHHRDGRPDRDQEREDQADRWLELRLRRRDLHLARLDQAPVDLRVVQVGRHGRAADHPQREGSPEDDRDPRPTRGGG